MAKKKAIICDLDGTLAIIDHRNPYDASTAMDDILNDPVANVIRVYANQQDIPVSLILLSGREDKYRKVTEQWLNKHSITHYDGLYMRKSGDRRKDSIIKKELYDRYIKDTYDIIFVLDDRDQVVKMWREIGLTCFQVNYGDF
jgi:hydroxymethylpyrimidine pyrophosphatase-like HAD family hydrolase